MSPISDNLAMSDNLAVELAVPRADDLAPTVANVRASCAAAASAPDSPVKVDVEAARALGAELGQIPSSAPGHLMGIDAAFSGNNAKANFIVALHLFNFGHAYRHPLHQYAGQGAWQTMLAGIQRMHQAAAPDGINAAFLADVTSADVCQWLMVPADQVLLTPLIDMTVAVAHATARDLRAANVENFAEFMEASRSRDATTSACAMVEALARGFAAFNDRRQLANGSYALLLKKAQIAVGELWLHLAADEPERYDYHDLESLTVVCDNVLPCVLRARGILKLDATLGARIDGRTPLPAGMAEASLRAAAVYASEIMLEAAPIGINSKQLSDWLWTSGKDPQFRPLERHATPDTCFY